MLLGAHVSIAGGLFKAPIRGQKIGCTAIQIFSKNQMQWKAKRFSADAIAQYKTEFKNSSVTSVLVHDSYLINLGSPEKSLLKKSRAAFGDEIQSADAIGASCLVFHPGAYMSAGEESGLRTIAENLNIVLDLKYFIK